MKYFLIAAHCLLLSASPLIAAENSKPENKLDWSIQQTWTMDAEPLEFVQSLDNKKVFVLGSDSTVYIFTPEGTKLGKIPVDKNTTSIDIAPRGETLYLINKKDKSYTALDISVIQKIDITGSPFLGKENAPVAFVVFSDFQ